ncbi:M12 family metallopeptidase [Aquimarina macrocephali]|uniref:M12 family metallopeptidase n=1 Tax=Aquimarina macrocephali TaxID=666563 RepID=UPI000464506A|nr:M12 family metallopeptidase [Aquimarina macrocephali]
MNTKKKFRAFKTLALGTVLLFASCQKEDVEESVTENATASNEKLIEKYFDGDLVTVEEMGNGEYLYNDDIILSEEHVSDTPQDIDQKLAIYGPARKWPNNTVIYVLSSNLNSRLRTNIRTAMNRWSRKTNIRFKQRTNESYYVTIRQSTAVCSGCGSASLGVNGNRGSLRLGRNASASLVAHELGHTLGFVHEQTRPDRDNHVIIKWENIQSGKAGNFRKSNNSRRLTSKFDIKSIMMYHAYGFSKNGKPTITLRNGRTYTGAQRTISPLDIQGTNAAYPRR